MGTIETGADNDQLAGLELLPTDELRLELSRSLEMTAKYLRRLATIVRILESRGVDLSDLRLGFLGYLRRIAYGQVLPEVVVRFGESPSLVQVIGQLPAPDQARLAAGSPVEMVVRREGGGFDIRKADPLRMTRHQVAQVFRRGEIRGQAEQILVIEGKEKPTPPSGTPSTAGSMRADRQKGGLVIGRRFYPAGTLVAALELLAEPPTEVPEIGIPVKLTEAEHLALKNAATRAGTTMTALIRRALRVAGLFAGA